MSGCECRVCGYYHPGEGCVIDDALVSKLVRERDEAREEVERLSNLTASMQDWSAEKDAMVAELHEQCDEIKRLLEDAERYRTIRRMIRDGIPPFDNDWYDEAELDAAIDAARAANAAE